MQILKIHLNRLINLRNKIKLYQMSKIDNHWYFESSNNLGMKIEDIR